MTLAQFFAIIGGVLLSLGGGGAIVAGLAQYVGKRWADRALEKQKQEYAQLNIQFQSQLELATRRIQVELERISLLHKLRTEQEFVKLYELWKKLIRVIIQVGSEARQPLSDSAESYNRQSALFEELKQFRQFAMDEAMLIPAPIFQVVRDFLAVLDEEAATTNYAIALTSQGGGVTQYAAVTAKRESNLQKLTAMMDKFDPMIRSHLAGETKQQSGATEK
jgi:hypothetical protein